MHDTWMAVRKVFRDRQMNFLVAVVVLVLAAVTLNGAASFLQLHFKKLPVPLAHALDTIPSRLGPWVCVCKDEQVDSELAEELGTENFIFRDYVNSSVVMPGKMAEFDGKSPKQCKKLVAQLRGENPDSVVNLAVTYYTGKADTVAHIPERCYVAGGYEPTHLPDTLTWDAGSTKTPGGKVDVRFINFEDQSGISKVSQSVAYFFHCNGVYESDPLAVRRKLQNLRARYCYYAKVELMTTEADEGKSAAVMTDFLRNALPEIEMTLPEWKNPYSQ